MFCFSFDLDSLLGVFQYIGTLYSQEAFLAQMVERWPFKPMAVGSIPTEGVFFSLTELLEMVPK